MGRYGRIFADLLICGTGEGLGFVSTGVSANLVHGFERFILQNLISYPGYRADGGRNWDADPH
jgi:hypothetical protein